MFRQIGHQPSEIRQGKARQSTGMGRRVERAVSGLCVFCLTLCLSIPPTKYPSVWWSVRRVGSERQWRGGERSKKGRKTSGKAVKI